jgi:hypothetical protein
LVELEGGYAAAETGYENALWLLHVLLDDHFYDGGKIKDEDRVGVEKRELFTPEIVVELTHSAGSHPIPSGCPKEEDGRCFDVIQAESLRGKLPDSAAYS